MLDLRMIGADWAAEQTAGIVESITHVTPVEYNEAVRYLPDSVTPMPGFMRFDINPFMREIVDACDPRSPIREVNLMKGVQITYTTMLESILLYYIGKVKTRPSMMISADRELVKGRVENYILPMLQQSELSHLIRSSDEGNSRKTGKTANHLQWEGGGFLVPAGANNADKLRSWSIMLMLKDEIDAWLETVGKDGDPDALTDDRCAAFWDMRKIFRGSTPLIEGASKIHSRYLEGDQRKYHVNCKGCGFPQPLRWSTQNKKNGVVGGMLWETESGVLIPESVRWACAECGHAHAEYDKTHLFSEEHGAQWVPTAVPKSKDIRSYHLPALYSPVGFQPWHKCVAAYIDSYDATESKVKNIGKYQVFYNNILGEPFKVIGARIKFEAVSSHRRSEYLMGEVPSKYAATVAGSPIMFLICTVDVHKSNLAVAVFGFCRAQRCFLISYERMQDDDCTDPSSPVWERLRAMIDEKLYRDDEGRTYRIALTLIDAGYSNSVVVNFALQWASGVHAIMGRQTASKNQAIKEFAPFETKAGGVGYLINVDLYKDRMAPVLRREWDGVSMQRDGHFNAPLDVSDKALKELTVEWLKKKTNVDGVVTHSWHRPSGVDNELWDLLGYAHAGCELLAWRVCREQLGLEAVQWSVFFDACENNLFFSVDTGR